MKPVARNIGAFLVGLLVGGAVNMGLITLSPHVIAPPPGVDVTNTESLAASIHLFAPKQFLFPFLAHALGTFTGALTAFLLAATRRRALALGIGALNLAGGITAAFLIPAPAWFIGVDLVGAYIPMAWIAIQLGQWMGRTAAPA